MKPKNHSLINHSKLILVTTLTTLGWLGLPLSSVHAITASTETVTTTSSSEIAMQEIQLKEKELEYENAKLDQKKSEALELHKSSLEIEIKKLQLLKARRDLLVQETKERVAMMMEGDVLFDVNSAVIKPGAMIMLKQVGLLLSEYPTGKITVSGFADSTGSAQDNLVLSRTRAESVKTYLLDKSAPVISSERVLAQGMGESKPVASNLNSAGRQLNRRVEITVDKL